MKNINLKDSLYKTLRLVINTYPEMEEIEFDGKKDTHAIRFNKKLKELRNSI